MAKRLVEFPLAGGGTVLVQAADGGHDGGEVTRGWGDRDGQVVLQAQQSFEHAVGRVQPADQALVRRLRSLTDGPEGITVDVGTEVRASVAGASSTGDVTASMTWRPGRTAGQAPAPAGSGRGHPTTGVP